jgi:hypothetical protein
MVSTNSKEVATSQTWRLLLMAFSVSSLISASMLSFVAAFLAVFFVIFLLAFASTGGTAPFAFAGPWAFPVGHSSKRKLSELKDLSHSPH